MQRLLKALHQIGGIGLAGSLAANRANHDAGWTWIKALLGIVMFEGTLITISGSAQGGGTLGARGRGRGRSRPAR
jgi:hypothetical protein